MNVEDRVFLNLYMLDSFGLGFRVQGSNSKFQISVIRDLLLCFHDDVPFLCVSRG